VNRLDGKVALVTGGGQGVGLGIARAMASAGARVALVDRVAERAQRAAAEIGGIALVGDVVSPADAVRCVDDAVRRLGRLDVLVNNAHQVIGQPLLEVTDESLETVHTTGFLGVFNFMKAARPHLGRGASIINIVSSVMLKTDTSGFALYAATKTAIRSMTRTVACEWGRDGIRVNALSPQTDSPAWAVWSAANPEKAAKILSEIPAGYVGDAERDVGPVAVFLASDAARYVTGSLVLADGGRGQLR
jgi:meso-butanediol dehydrogenase / (S,S)-butanediol dehydrogenase / diacetyl reductase